MEVVPLKVLPIAVYDAQAAGSLDTWSAPISPGQSQLHTNLVDVYQDDLVW